MRSLLQCLSTLAMGGAVALVAAGAWAWYDEARMPSAGSWLVISPAVTTIKGLGANVPRHIAFQVVNQNLKRPAILLGGCSSCESQGCVIIEGLPLAVSPGGTTRFEVEYKSFKAGRFTREFPIYTDCPGQAEIPLTIIAEVAEAQASTLTKQP